MKKCFYLKFLVMVLLLYSCKKTDVNPLNSDLEFQLRLLDSNGRVTTTFKEGENFRFSFLIINKTQKSWGLKQESLNSNEEFFRVYQNFGDKKTVGRPLISPIFNEKIPNIPVIDTLRLEMDWMPSITTNYRRLDNYHFDNKPLPVGKYKTSFSNVFEFDSNGTGSKTYKTNLLNFTVDFEIK